jgi:cysteine desulfuration protein SufE
MEGPRHGPNLNHKQKFYMNHAALFESCLEKQDKIVELFSSCPTPQLKYEKIIELGRNLTPYPIEFKTAEHLVKGCQSQMYLHASLVDGKMHFQVYSEALISAGLAALLLAVYQNEPPESLLSCPPRFLEELGIHESLSPGRSNGLSSLFLRMKQESLKFLVAK